MKYICGEELRKGNGFTEYFTIKLKWNFSNICKILFLFIAFSQ